ncbi:MAG: gliding motility-associated ABC transporter substrate-binding protein GldG [Prevotellaceae bacterium]|jgi:ABC-2 type transport system permease protein|nr:gliding motility-associated ABC transporter substrate-binding protein GldG [Prevotellaceae bacterium]
MHNKNLLKYIIFAAILAIAVLLFAKIIFFRIDLTSEKRYTITKNSKELLKNISEPLQVNIYLGEADANIARLKTAVNEMLDEFSVYTAKSLIYKYINPSDAATDRERYENYNKLEQRGLTPMSVSVRDNQGKIIQNTIFAWAEVMLKNDTIPVCLMQPLGRTSGEENVNTAIESLEYQFIDAIRILTRKSFDKIAFIEGHGELLELDVFFAQEELHRYYEIYRGEIGDTADCLADYKAIIIAKPTEKFSESDKFILDQYIMNGGKVLWLLDAIRISPEELSKSGISPVVPLDLNLIDMLFHYGIRVEPSVVQDLQCILTPVNVALLTEPAHFENVPLPYFPLLMPSPYHPITKNLMQVKSEYPSYLSQVSEENGIDMQVLLITSNASHVDAAPTNIDLKNMIQSKPDVYFNMQFIPVAVAMEGEFESVFAHRLPPKNVINFSKIKEKSVKNKMIVVADGDIIRNEIQRSEKGSIGILPLGFDRLTGQTYGNNNFIINALQYLTEDSSWIDIRNRALRLRLLNKLAITQHRVFWQTINVIVPLLLLAMFGGGFLAVRKRREMA